MLPYWEGCLREFGGGYGQLGEGVGMFCDFRVDPGMVLIKLSAHSRSTSPFTSIREA